MPRILLRSGKSPFQAASREEFLHQDLIGTNSGNLLFSDAAHKLLTVPGTEVVSNGLKTDFSPERAAQINEQNDAFVIPLANAFRPSFRGSLDRLSRLIEQLTIPVVVFGVGAQVGDDYDTLRLKPIEASVRRFVEAVLARSASIGVRGELTAEYLRSLGYRDVEVIGCPSMFLHGDQFPAPRTPEPFTEQSRIAMNLSPDALRVGDIAEIARHAAERFPHLMYFAQNLTDAELLFWGDTSSASGLSDPFPSQLSHPLLQENRVRVPLDPATWMAELRSYQFAFGTRIHGNIAALLAGTPAVVLVHDSRTLELCRYFEIPHRMLRHTAADVDPESLYADADYAPMLAGHRERFDRVVAFLDRNGLPNAYSHGDRGAAFDERVADLDLPASLQVWDGSDDGALRYRFSRLREDLNHVRTVADKRIAGLTAKNKALQSQVAEITQRYDGVQEELAGLRQALADQNADIARLRRDSENGGGWGSAIESTARRLGPALRRRARVVQAGRRA